MTPTIQSKSDRDKVRQRSAGNRARLQAIQKIVNDCFEQGRAASACMVDIKNILKGA